MTLSFMKLLSFKKQPDKMFLAIILSDCCVQSALWQIIDGNIQILEKSSVYQLDEDEESKLKIIDQSLQILGKDGENIEEVLFGLEADWVNNNGLVVKRKPFLKKINDILEFKPIGYIVAYEAFMESLIENPALRSCLVFYLQPESIRIALVKEQRELATFEVGRSNDIIADIVEGIARLKQKTDYNGHLPNEFVLVSISQTGDEIMEIKQSIHNQTWNQDFNFLQEPTIKIVSHDRLMEDLIIKGGTVIAEELGYGDIQLDLDDKQKEEQNDFNQDEESNVDNVSDDEVDQQDIENIQEVELALDPSLMVNPLPKGKKVVEHKDKEASSFGVPINEEKLKVKTKRKKLKDRIKMMHRSNKRSNSNIDLKALFVKSFLVGLVFGCISLLIIGFFYLKKTYKVIISLKPAVTTIAKDIELTLDTKQQSSPKDLVVNAKLVEEEFSGEKTIETTGTDTIGEKATGVVTVYNKTDSEGEFEAGTVIETGSLEFKILEDITVEAAVVEETEDGESKQYGRTTVEVKAVQIGTESNLEEEINLKIDNYSISAFSCSVKEAFTGGTEEEVRVVAQEDVDKLLQELKEELYKKAEDKYKQDSAQGQYFIPTGKITVVSAEYDEEVEDQAEAVKLDLKTTISAYSYHTKDLVPLAQEVLESEVPPNYILKDDLPSILISSDEELSENGEIVINANISSTAYAVINIDEIREQLVGHKIGNLNQTLAAKESVADSSFELLPKLSKFIFKKLPSNEQNIVLQVSNEK